MEKVLERDQKLSQLDDRADALQVRVRAGRGRPYSPLSSPVVFCVHTTQLLSILVSSMLGAGGGRGGGSVGDGRLPLGVAATLFSRLFRRRRRGLTI